MKEILLVDDHKIVRDGLRYYFETVDRYHIAAEAENGEQALGILKENKFDLVITDISMPKMDGIDLLKEIKQINPDQPVLALTMLDESRHIKKMISYGINGYLLKNSSEDAILKAIDRILEGEKYFPEEVTQTLINDIAGNKTPKRRLTVETPLSHREKEILALIVDELSNQEIADKLFISTRTVDAHKRNLLQKTGAKNIAGLVIYALEHGITGMVEE